jgi:hypothetical protein
MVMMGCYFSVYFSFTEFQEMFSYFAKDASEIKYSVILKYFDPTEYEKLYEQIVKMIANKTNNI